MWFEELFGFKETDYNTTKANLEFKPPYLRSLVNGKQYNVGSFYVGALSDFRFFTPYLGHVRESTENGLKVSQIVADVRQLHVDPNNAGATFQVASQFNLLEMPNPNITPEMGVSNYQHDRTQGPACAIACGAGAVFRNYFARVSEEHCGQTDKQQINTLIRLEWELQVTSERLGMGSFDILGEYKNGYVLITQEQLNRINAILEHLNNDFELMSRVFVGVHYGIDVTLPAASHSVNQVYCSALPIAYNNCKLESWERLAKLILKANYLATLYAVLNIANKSKSNVIYLTLLGAGAFGTPIEWVLESMFYALSHFKGHSLDVRIVSYGSRNPLVDQAITQFNVKLK